MGKALNTSKIKTIIILILKLREIALHISLKINLIKKLKTIKQ